MFVVCLYFRALCPVYVEDESTFLGGLPCTARLGWFEKRDRDKYREKGSFDLNRTIVHVSVSQSVRQAGRQADRQTDRCLSLLVGCCAPCIY